MFDSRPKGKYNCTQAELYAICAIGWNSYGENQLTFEEFSTLYTIAFGTDALAAVQAAKELPDKQARNAETETAYILMGQAAEQCLTNWRYLRSYIKAAFPSELYKPKTEAAGVEHYTKALTRNWGETELMLTSAQTFITDHTAELTLGGMPLTFDQDFQDAHTEFLTQYNTFTDSGQDEHEGTDEKIVANNAIYDKLLSMFEDGQVIYEHDPAKRDRFIFSKVKALITNPSGSGSEPVPPDTIEIGAIVLNSVTELPVEGATLTILNTPSGEPAFATSDQDGILALKVSGYAPNAPALVQLEISAVGYETDSGETEFTSGQLYSIDVSLNPVIVP